MSPLAKVAAFAVALSGAGCGTLASNADVPAGVYVGVAGRESVADTANLKVMSTGPAVGKGGVQVSGYSCKNKIWQPAPSRDNAIALMKRQAEQQGFHAIYAVDAHDDPAALTKNCWSGIEASGIAFNP